LAKGASAAGGRSTARQSATVYFRATESIPQKTVACYISGQHSGNAADLCARSTSLILRSVIPLCLLKHKVAIMHRLMMTTQPQRHPVVFIKT